MKTSEAEKDWLRRISGQNPTDSTGQNVKKAGQEAVEQKPVPEEKKKGNGFSDIARHERAEADGDRGIHQCAQEP